MAKMRTHFKSLLFPPINPDTCLMPVLFRPFLFLRLRSLTSSYLPHSVETIETYQPRLVPAGGCTIEGYYLPEGTVVSTQPHLMNHHPAIFPAPEKFDPDRWYV